MIGSPRLWKRKQRLIVSFTGRRLKTQLEVLQEKLKVHEKQIKEPTRVQSSSSTLVSATASTTVDSICPVPAIRNDHAMTVDFFMSR